MDDLDQLMNGARKALDAAKRKEGIDTPGANWATQAVMDFDSQRAAAPAEPDECDGYSEGAAARQALALLCKDLSFHCPEGFWDEVLLGDLLIQSGPGMLKEETLAAVDAWLKPRARDRVADRLLRVVS